MKSFWISLLFFAQVFSAHALEVPFLSGHVNDEAHLLNAANIKSLDDRLLKFEQQTGHQVVVLTLPSLQGEVLEEYSLKVARSWKLGRKGKNDGILLLVVRDDRKVRIEVGYGLEGNLPDALAGRIIRGEMIPQFKSGDYANGISKGINAIINVLDGIYSPPPDPAYPTSGGVSTFQKIIVGLLVLGLLSIFELIGLFTPGLGWFFYLFLIPFWSVLPIPVFGPRAGYSLTYMHLMLFPVLKSILSRTRWGRMKSKSLYIAFDPSNFNSYCGRGGNYYGGGGFGGGGFSGGGGSFGGGGSSGSW